MTRFLLEAAGHTSRPAAPLPQQMFPRFYCGNLVYLQPLTCAVQDPIKSSLETFPSSHARIEQAAVESFSR